MTRITNQILVSNLIKNLRDNMERIDTLSNALSSGKRVTKPSDDPLAASRGLFYRRVLRENAQFKLNADNAAGFLITTSDSLEDVRTSLRSARNIALQGANDASNMPNETMATQVGDILKNILNLANKAHDGKYIFSGDKIKAAPFVNNNGIVTFAGDNSVRKVETGLGVTEDGNVPGEGIFGVRAHKIIGDTGALPANVPLRAALGAALAQKNILVSGAAVAPAAGNVSELTVINAANFAGFVAGSIRINNGVTNYDVAVNTGDTIGAVLDRISQVPGINAYFRASDQRIILSNDFGQNITVTDVGATVFAALGAAGNLAGGTNSTTQEIFSVKSGTTSMNVVDYVDPDYDTNVDLAAAVSARRTRVGSVDLNGLFAGFNRGTTTLNSLAGFVAGSIDITAGGTTVRVTTDADDTVQTLVSRINTAAGRIGVRAYVRRVTTAGVSAHNIVLAGTQDAAITVTDVGAGTFAALTGITAGLGADVRTGSNVTASVNDAGNLEMTSQVEGASGDMSIRQGANRAQNAGGILESLSVADSDGVVTGKDLRPGQVFERLSKMQSALRGRAFGRDTLMNLRDGSSTNLGLQPLDIITFTADTNVGAPTTLTMTVAGGVNQVNTLQDVADTIQNFLRTNAAVQAQTAIVQIIDGQLTITNPRGASVNGAATNVSQPVTVTAFSATDSTGATARATFDNTMLNLVNAGQIQDDGSSASTYSMSVSFISQNVSESISEMDALISNLGTYQGNAGSALQRLELVKNRLEDADVSFTTLLSENEDVDMAKAILEFQQQQNVYQAALGAAARILQPTLLDFLR